MSTNSQEYEPKFSISECDAEQNGTIIELDDLKRKSDFDKDGLAISLSKLFNFLMIHLRYIYHTMKKMKYWLTIN